MHVVFVHAGEIEEHALLLVDHTAHTVLHDDRNLVTVGRVVRDTVGYGRCEYVAMPVLMLQALAGERRAPRGAADHEASRALIGASPDEIADALKAEHRVIDVKRNRLNAVIAVGSAGSELGT